MGNLIEIVGQKFDRWTVLSKAGHNTHGQLMYLCRCDCGTERSVNGGDLRGGLSKSCGCARRETLAKIRTSHGQARSKKKTPEYVAWMGMHRRCNNPHNKRYARYGGRGITVCERWKSFENFFADMGQKPSPRHSIDRENNDGNYEPGNCRWATPREQVLNRGVFRNNTSGVTGVVRRGNRWIARHRVNYRQIDLGSFKRREDAEAAYRSACAADTQPAKALRAALNQRRDEG